MSQQQVINTEHFDVTATETRTVVIDDLTPYDGTRHVTTSATIEGLPFSDFSTVQINSNTLETAYEGGSCNYSQSYSNKCTVTFGSSSTTTTASSKTLEYEYYRSTWCGKSSYGGRDSSFIRFNGELLVDISKNQVNEDTSAKLKAWWSTAKETLKDRIKKDLTLNTLLQSMFSKLTHVTNPFTALVQCN